VLDWMMTLPEHLSKELWQNIHELEQEKKMAYVSSFERFATEAGMQAGMQAGRQEGRQEGRRVGEVIALQRLLSKRFGAIPTSHTAAIEVADLSQIEAWFDRAITANSFADVFAEQ